MNIAVWVILLAVSYVDSREKRIPNRLLAVFFLCAVAAGQMSNDLSWTERILGSIPVSVLLLIVTGIRQGAFGAGDVKLMAVSGFFLGVRRNLAAFVFAVAFAGIYCMICIAGKRKEKTETIAFGPFLCAGIALAMVYGDAFVRWYLK